MEERLPTNLNEKAVEGKWVLVQHYASSISNDLANAANHHTYCEALRLVMYALDEVDDTRQSEENDETDIGGK